MKQKIYIVDGQGTEIRNTQRVSLLEVKEVSFDFQPSGVRLFIGERPVVGWTCVEYTTGLNICGFTNRRSELVERVKMALRSEGHLIPGLVKKHPKINPHTVCEKANQRLQ